MLDEFKRRLARTLVRSGLDMTDEMMILSSLWTDFGSEKISSSEMILKAWRDALSGGMPAGHRLKLEIMFPLCPEKCLFCNLGTRKPSGPGEVKRYAESLREEMIYFAPTFSRQKIDAAWVGRGTPTLLPTGDLRSLLNVLLDRYDIDRGGIVGIECNPMTVDFEKIRMLRGMGFNQISFGVETLNPDILRLIRRGYQTYDGVRSAVKWARDAGFDDINLDLVFGFHGDPIESFLAGFGRVADLRPTTITVCSLSLTDAYRRAAGVGRQAHLQMIRNTLPRAMEGLARSACDYGYSTDELVSQRGVWRFIAEETPAGCREKWLRSESGSSEPSSLLGFGPGARSRIFGRGLYSRTRSPFMSGGPVFKRYALSQREQMAHYALYCLNNDSKMNMEEFRRIHGKKFCDEFGLETQILKSLGKVIIEGEWLIFLPVEPPERIFYGAVFLLDTLSRSRFSGRQLGGGFRRSLMRSLA